MYCGLLTLITNQNKVHRLKMCLIQAYLETIWLEKMTKDAECLSYFQSSLLICEVWWSVQNHEVLGVIVITNCVNRGQQCIGFMAMTFQQRAAVYRLYMDWWAISLISIGLSKGPKQRKLEDIFVHSPC